MPRGRQTQAGAPATAQDAGFRLVRGGDAPSQGWEPREPGKAAPFDLGWRDGDGTVWIAEVKSLARTSESQQLRLGLGQVLDYRQAIATPEMTVRAALVVEQEPSDLRWVDVCSAVGVILAWPDRFSAAFTSGASPKR